MRFFEFCLPSFIVLLGGATLATAGQEKTRTGEDQEAEVTGDMSPMPSGPRVLSRSLRIAARPEPRWVGAPISLSLKDADLAEVLRTFARIADVNLILHPGVEGKVTVELNEVPWDQALDVILKSQGLGYELSGRVWRVRRRR